MQIRALRTEGFRLSALYAGVFTLSMILLGSFLMVTIDQSLRRQILQFSASDIAAIRNGYDSKGVHEAREVVDQLMAAPASSDFYLLQQGEKVVGANLAPMRPRTGAVELPASAATRGHPVLGVGTFLAPGLYVFAGKDMAGLRTVESHILNVMLVLLGAGLLLAVLGGALASRRFLRRTDAMARACRDIMDGDLNRRIPLRGTGDELDRLAEAVNAMLSRIVALMENLAQVSNDIAHDLRTPVTHLRHRLERARSESRTAEDHAVALDAAIAKADEILGLFTALLRIAQIEGSARRAAFAPVDLGALLGQMRELFEPVTEESGHQLRLDIVEPAIVRGDHQLLTQLFSNLIENAVVHTQAGTRVTLSLEKSDSHVIARVSDDGAGVPREEHERLFRRLYRREASRTQPGYGLGLSLVAAIAELHGARARILVRDAPGLCVEIAFAPIPA